MKSPYGIKVPTAVVLALASALLTLPSEAMAGQEGRNGTSLCRKGDEAPVPCDLYFEERDYELPYRPEQRFTLDSLPEEVRRELEEVNALLWRRSDGQLDLLAFARKNVQFYDTKDFLGVEHPSGAPGVESRQVGAAYEYYAVSPKDKTQKQLFRVVELDLPSLATLAPRNQALVILHELMHFFPAGHDHSVISPLIKALSAVLVVHDEQKTYRRRLTQEELAASSDLSAYLVHFGLPSFIYRSSMIHPMGGGVIEVADAPVAVSESNFIGIGSMVKAVTPGQAYYWRHAVMIDSLTRLAPVPDDRAFQEVGLTVGAGQVDGDSGLEIVSLVKGRIAPVRRCTEFDGQGKCVAASYWAPMEFSLRVGKERRVERFVITLRRWSKELHDSVVREGVAGCSVSLGQVEYKDLRHQLGHVVQANLGAVDCETVTDLLDGKVQAAIDANASGGPLLLFGAGGWMPGRNPDASDLRGFAYGLQFGLAGGLRFYNRVDLSAYVNAQMHGVKQGDQSAELTSPSGGVRAKMHLTPNVLLGAEFSYSMDSLSKTRKGAEDSYFDRSYVERFFGITLTAHHDFLGPYPR